jgi:hypothetical protein
MPTFQSATQTRHKRGSQITPSALPDLAHTFTSGLEAIEHAIDYMNKFLNRSGYYISRLTDAEMRCLLPYVPMGLTDGSHRHIYVNREYKPLGSNREYGDFAKYEDYSNQSFQRPTGAGGSEAALGFPFERALFNDGCPPWNSRSDAVAYRNKLVAISYLLSACNDTCPNDAQRVTTPKPKNH